MNWLNKPGSKYRFDEAAEMLSPEQSDEKLAFSVVFGRCSTAFATKQIETQAPSTLTRVNVKMHSPNENDLRPDYRFHIVFGMFCIHVPHWNYFDKQLLSWLRNSATPLFRLQACDQLIFTVDQLVNHFRPGLVQKRHSKYGLKCRLLGFLPSLKDIKYRAGLRCWRNEYVWANMSSCIWR